MAFNIRTPREGELFITIDHVPNPGCYTTGGAAGYIDNSLSLRINGVDYPLHPDNIAFLGFGFLNIKSPVILQGGQQIQLIVNCDNSLTSNIQSVLPRNFSLGVPSSVPACSEGIDLTITWDDYIRLSFPTNGQANGTLVPYSHNNLFKLEVQRPGQAFQPVSQSDFEFDSGSGAGTYTVDGTGVFSVNNTSGDNIVLLSKNGYPVGTRVRLTKVGLTGSIIPKDWTIAFGNILVQGVENEAGTPGQVTDLSTGLITNTERGTVYVLHSDPTGYDLTVDGVANSNAPLSFTLSDGGAGGTFTPTQATNGAVVHYSFPPTTGTVTISAAYENFQLAKPLTLTNCPLTAVDKAGSVNQGQTGQAVPDLEGQVPAGCTLDGFIIDSLPTCAILKLGTNPVTVGQRLTQAQANSLTIDVPVNCPQSSFTFTYHAVSDTVGCTPSAPATVTLTSNTLTANAEDDENSGITGQPVSGTVAGNDTPCNLGSTFYQLIPGSAVQGSVTSFDTVTGAYTFTPSGAYVGDGSFRYEIRCGSSLQDSVVLDTATVTIHYTCAPVAGGTVQGPTAVTFGGVANYYVDGLTGTGPFTYQWTVQGATLLNGQGSPAISVQISSLDPITATVVVSNCSGNFSVTRSLSINPNPGVCVLEVPIKINCPPAPYTVKVTLLDQPGEANRANPSVIATQGASSVFFNGIKDGQAHDYLITITNATGGEVGTIKILNRKCP